MLKLCEDACGIDLEFVEELVLELMEWHIKPASSLSSPPTDMPIALHAYSNMIEQIKKSCFDSQSSS